MFLQQEAIVNETDVGPALESYCNVRLGRGMHVSQGRILGPLERNCLWTPRMTQFLRDQASDSEEVVTPLMLDGTYLSRNFATLGPLT